MNLDAMILSLVIFLPMVAFFIISFLPRENAKLIKTVSVVFSTGIFLVSLHLFYYFDPNTAAMQFVYAAPWIPKFGIFYSVGIDGISILLVLLTTITMPIAILSSWSAITEKVKGYMLSMFMLEFGMIGVFCATDMFLFYCFWEAMLIPMYFLIGIWGGANRIYAAIKFFIFTMFGSLLMLVALIYMYFQTGPMVVDGQIIANHSFALEDFYAISLPFDVQVYLFVAYALAFAIKVPMFPFHTWLPDAHVEAPTAGSVILAGVLLKMGTYGFLRFCLPFFPSVATHETVLMTFCVLAVIGIIYGALVAMVQPDVKKLVAYSSVSHLGFVMLGIFAFNLQGMQGGLIQMINHGISTGALFLMVGMIYERRHTRLIAEYGGLWKVIPAFSVVFMIVTMSSLGLPGTNGFVGEFLVLVGSFTSEVIGNKIFAVLAMSGVILAAVYLLWMYQRVVFGEVTNPKNEGLKDLNLREYAVILPLVILIFWLGVYPKTFLSMTEKSVEALIETVESKKQIALELQNSLTASD